MSWISFKFATVIFIVLLIIIIYQEKIIYNEKKIDITDISFENEIQNILRERRRPLLNKLLTGCREGMLRGCLTGSVTGGVIGSITGGALFGLINPLMIYINEKTKK